jgi:hypothetical protein
MCTAHDTDTEYDPFTVSRRYQFCEVADTFCSAPAGYGTSAGTYTCQPGRDETTDLECDACGSTVCANCSDNRDLNDRLGVRRVCHSCQIEHDGDDSRVRAKFQAMAA